MKKLLLTLSFISFNLLSNTTDSSAPTPPISELQALIRSIRQNLDSVIASRQAIINDRHNGEITANMQAKLMGNEMFFRFLQPGSQEHNTLRPVNQALLMSIIAINNAKSPRHR